MTSFVRIICYLREVMDWELFVEVLSDLGSEWYVLAVDVTFFCCSAFVGYFLSSFGR